MEFTSLSEKIPFELEPGNAGERNRKLYRSSGNAGTLFFNHSSFVGVAASERLCESPWFKVVQSLIGVLHLGVQSF